MVFGLLKGQSLYNWDLESSYFFAYNQCTFAGSIWEIWLAIFLLFALRNFMIIFFLMIAYWYFQNAIAGVFLMMVLFVTETLQGVLRGGESLALFLRRFFADYSFWISPVMRIKMLVAAAVYGIFLYAAAHYVAKKKEFLYAKKS